MGRWPAYEGTLTVDIAAETPVGPPWLAIVLGVLALLTAAVAAYGPVLVEKAKQRKAVEEKSPAVELPRAADGALALVDEALDDLKAERDYWKAKAEACRDQDRANAVTIAKLEARVEALEHERDRLIDKVGRRDE